jgi:hypothetical protein
MGSLEERMQLSKEARVAIAMKDRLPLDCVWPFKERHEMYRCVACGRTLCMRFTCGPKCRHTSICRECAELEVYNVYKLAHYSPATRK